MNDDKIKAGAAPEEPAGASVSIKTELSEEAAKAPQSGPGGGSVSIKTELPGHEPAESPLPPEWAHKSSKLRAGEDGAESAGAHIIKQLTAGFQEKHPKTTGAIGGTEKGLNNLNAVREACKPYLRKIWHNFKSGELNRRQISNEAYKVYKRWDPETAADEHIRTHKKIQRESALKHIETVIKELEEESVVKR